MKSPDAFQARSGRSKMSPADVLGSEEDLRSYVAMLVHRHGRAATSLEELVRACQGAFPTLVSDIARWVADQNPGLLIPDALDQQSTVSAPLAAATSVLPLPHPLDFEWRFSPQGCAVLAGWLDDYLHPGEPVALLGTPAFAEQFAGFSSRGTPTLFERRSEACAALRALPSLEVVHGSLQDTCRGHAARFTAAVADPPWYPHLSEVFLRGAAHVLQFGGVLLFNVPGLATRPNIPAERTHLIQTALATGLVLESIAPGAIEYESPPFEIAALAAAGLPGFDTRWRRGDLLRFRRVPVDAAVGTSAADVQAEPVSEWREVTVGRARIRVDVALEPDGARPLESIVTGDVLESVSSRDPRRVGVNVWTTTNRVFRTGEPRALLAALEAATGSGEPTGAPDYVSVAVELIEQETRILQLMGIE